jgi:hypothetical protein
MVGSTLDTWRCAEPRAGPESERLRPGPQSPSAPTAHRASRRRPVDRLHSFYRGCHPSVYGEHVEAALIELGNRLDGDACRAIWSDAVRSAWTSPLVWFHGDVAVEPADERGTSQRGDRLRHLRHRDPACDLVIAWTFLSAKNDAASARPFNFQRTHGHKDGGGPCGRHSSRSPIPQAPSTTSSRTPWNNSYSPQATRSSDAAVTTTLRRHAGNLRHIAAKAADRYTGWFATAFLACRVGLQEFGLVAESDIGRPNSRRPAGTPVDHPLPSRRF